MTRHEFDSVMIELRQSVRNTIKSTPLRRKEDSMYVQGLLDLTSLIEQILKEHIDKDK